MKIDVKYMGKWIATKDDKILSSDLTFTKLKKKVEGKANLEDVKFVLIPKGYIAGISNEI